MSLVLIVSSAMRFVLRLVELLEQGLQLVEAFLDGAVDDRVADWATRPPSTDGSTIDLELDLLARGLVERLGEAGFLVVGERDRGAHLGDGQLLLGRSTSDELVDDRRQVTSPASPDHEADQ